LATSAHAAAWLRTSRPKPAKLATNLALRDKVEQYLEKKYSPEQISGRLWVEFPDDPEMWVSTETIYQSLYVQSRGALRRELTRCLRTGRALRHPGRQPGQRKNRIPNMVNISQRPPEAADRAVPGHWEGDLIVGKRNASAIGTLVERTTGYTMLVHLPDGYKPEQVAPALAAKIQSLPQTVRRSLTWDQGPEMRDWTQVAIAADIAIFFCDPHKPWQALAARHEREHQRPTAPVLPERQRPIRALRRRSGLGRRRAQRPTPQAIRLPQARRADRRSAASLTPRTALPRRHMRRRARAAGQGHRPARNSCPGPEGPVGQGPTAGRSRRDAQRP
jgi:hypothetical protein